MAPTMFINRDVDALYRGHDAGAYALPAPALAARTALLALTGRRQAAQLARDAADSGARYAMAARSSELAALAAAGEPLPDDLGAPVREARQAHERAALEVQLAVAAVAASEFALRGTLRASADPIYAALHAAVLEVVAAVRGLAPALEGLDLADTAAVVRSPAGRDAYGSLLDASERYDAIRRAQLAIWRITGHEGRLAVRAEIRDGGEARIHGLTGARRLLALVRGGAVLWVPGPEALASDQRRAPGEAIRVPAPEAGPGQPLGGRAMRGRRALPAPAGAEA